IASHGLNLYTLENYSEQKNHLKQKMMASCDPRAILFVANQSSEPEKTYQSNLQLCLERFVGQDKNLFELVNLEIKGSYPFTKVKEELDRQLPGLLNTMETVIEKSSVALIHDCTKIKSDSLLLTPFSGGSIFVESNVLTCINNRINKEIDQLLKGPLKNDYQYAGAGITYIESLLLPKYLNKLQYAIKQIHANE